MPDQALVLIRKNTRSKTIIDPNTGKRVDKSEYPVTAIRELLLNALIHRDYSIHTDSTPVTVRIFSDRPEIENPDGLYGRMTLAQLGKVSADPGNPLLANALEVMEVTEKRFSGIPTVIATMCEVGLSSPKFENERGVFRVTLFNDTLSAVPVYSKESELLDFCGSPKTREEIGDELNHPNENRPRRAARSQKYPMGNQIYGSYLVLLLQKDTGIYEICVLRKLL